MAMISLKEYAVRHGKDPSTARRKAEHGGFVTAKKVGRDWTIDEREIWKDNRITTGLYIGRTRNRKQKKEDEHGTH